MAVVGKNGLLGLDKTLQVPPLKVPATQASVSQILKQADVGCGIIFACSC